uniref:MSP domain-containing protein n=1 Tax=Steinernema glaseri TaxID=37863 RepID=A0A1I7Y4Y6_9BILA
MLLFRQQGKQLIVRVPPLFRVQIKRVPPEIGSNIKTIYYKERTQYCFHPQPLIMCVLMYPKLSNFEERLPPSY